MSAGHTTSPDRSCGVGYILLSASTQRDGPLAGLAGTLHRLYETIEVTVDGAGVQTAVDRVDRAVRELQDSCTSIVLVAAGADARGALQAAARLPAAIDAIVLADPVLEPVRPAAALFSGFAALSMVGLAIAGLGTRKRTVDGLQNLSQPVLVISTSSGTGARSRTVQSLQAGISGLVELAVVDGEDRSSAASEAVERLSGFAERMSLRALKGRRRAGQTQACARPQPALVGALATA